MTVDKHGFEVPEMFKEMLASDLKFNLTGSRFFGAKNPNDYDYFVQDEYNIDLKLRSLGFQMSHDKEWRYGDDNTVAVYKNHEYEYGQLPIHIQVVKNARLKMDAQRIILYFMLPIYNSYDNKHDRRLVWEAAYTLAGLGQIKFAEEDR